MNIQTEHLENHTAQFTVQVELDRLEQAKHSAARKIAQKINVPGFRRGKAPYKILVNYVGEGAILEEAMEELGNQVYKEALEQSELMPYGPGELADFKIEPLPTFIFTVPLQPTADLGDYRSIRLEYKEATIDDDAVNRAMTLLQEQQALVEESHQPVVMGNRVTLDIHSYFSDGKRAEDAVSEEAAEPTVAETAEEASPAAENTSAEPELDHDHDHEHEASDDPADIHHHVHDADEVFMHEHALVLRLEEGDAEPVIPGFSKALEGANVGEYREFELSYPDDKEKYAAVAGRKIKFYATVKKIETLTLPALNDEFAARLTEKEEKPLTLLELRIRVRENLHREATTQADSSYANQVLDKIIEGATVAYPDAMVDDQIDFYMEDMDRRLRQRGLTLEDYLRVTNKTKEELEEEYREPGQRAVKRSLVLLEIMSREKLGVSEGSVQDQIERMVTMLGGEQPALVRKAVDTPSMRTNIINDLMQNAAFERITLIAQGQAPELEPEVATEGESLPPSSESVPATSDPAGQG